MAFQDIEQMIYKYGREIEYGELIIKIKFHRGEVAEVEEVQPPLRKWRFEKKLDKPA